MPMPCDIAGNSSQHVDCKPLLSGFKGLLSEIAQAKGVFQAGVIDFHRPALLVISQGLFDRQVKSVQTKYLGDLSPGRFLEMIAWTGSVISSKQPLIRRVKYLGDLCLSSTSVSCQSNQH